MKYTLNITGYNTEVFLGSNDGEQDCRRPVIINIQICFNKKPQACDSDDISDTLCYDSLVRHINNCLLDRHFNLIESITQFIYNQIKTLITIPACIRVEVIKTNPMCNINATSFVIDDTGRGLIL